MGSSALAVKFTRSAHQHAGLVETGWWAVRAMRTAAWLVVRVQLVLWMTTGSVLMSLLVLATTGMMERSEKPGMSPDKAVLTGV